MSVIRLLDPQTANSIAAGEVVERPASVIKELVENSLDAGATTVSVEITGGGILSMAVNDNGRGMDAADARLAFARHATSKIRTITDLDTIGTLGFRGEALASIAAVARVSLRTRQAASADGYEVRIDGGTLAQEGPAGCPPGTTIRVEQLFYNTPARFKFLKKDASEAAAIAETMERLVLSRPDVSFRLLNNGQEILHSPGNNDLLSAIYAVYGRKQAGFCIPVAGQSGPIKVGGFVARPEGARNSRAGQTVLVNGRIIRAKAVTAALDEAFKTRLMKGRFAFAVLRLDLPQELVDVNVHPQKLEVRFWKDQEVFSAVYHAVLSSLNEHAGILENEQDYGAGTTIPAPLQQADVQTALPDLKTVRPSPEQTELPLADTLASLSSWQRPVQPEPTAPAADDDRPSRAAWPAAGSPAAVAPAGAATPTAMTASVGRTTQPPAPIQAYPLPDAAAGAVLRLGENALVTAMTAEPAIRPAEEAAGSHPGLLRASDLAQGRVIGQLFRTYILLEWQDELILIDQHAAHEKILYERLREAWRHKQHPHIQPLLVPQTMTVTPAERILFEAESDFFAALGFTLEAFGSNGLIIRTLPDLDSARIDAEIAVRTALQTLQSLRRNETGSSAAAPGAALPVPQPATAMPPAAVDEALYQMACKAAVKAHDRLSSTEIDRLIADLAPLDNPYTCPHGRPVIIRMSRLELEKKFKRVL